MPVGSIFSLSETFPATPSLQWRQRVQFRFGDTTLGCEVERSMAAWPTYFTVWPEMSSAALEFFSSARKRSFSA